MNESVCRYMSTWMYVLDDLLSLVVMKAGGEGWCSMRHPKTQWMSPTNA